MNGNWSVQLEDGPHTVSAEILTGMLTFKLKVIWDGSVIEETRIPALLGQILTTFQRSGHMFVIRQSGFGMIGKLVLAMDGRELAASGATQIASTPRPAPSASWPRTERS